MSLPRSFLEEIKNRIPVSEVVGRKVKLTRRGREFVGLSPFKNERTPSFTVNDDKQFYHCFSTGKHGSIFDFLMETEGLSFSEAVEQLAGQANLPMPARDPHAAAKEQKRLGLIDVISHAAAWFRLQLNSASGRDALAYLEQRGVSRELSEGFGLGFAPFGKQTLFEELRNKGFTAEQIVESGMAIQPDSGSGSGSGSGSDNAPYDRFQNRLMFPITDSQARPIAFGGRALSAQAKAKYINSPETPLYHKGSILYNFARARQPAYEAKSVLVCEGYMDVIGLARGGFHNAVAPMGTAITEQQLALLWRLAPEPVLCLDGDEAGLLAAHRVIDRALPILKPGFSLHFAILPTGQDPDDIIRAGGRVAMEGIIGRAMSLIDMLWEREISSAPYDTPERRAALTEKLRRAVRSISQQDVRTHYGEEIKQRLAQLFAPSNAGGGIGAGAGGGAGRGRGRGGKGWAGGAERGWSSPYASREARVSALASGSDILPAREAMIVLAILRHPQILAAHLAQFESLTLTAPPLNALRNDLINAINDAIDNDIPLDMAGLKTHLLDAGQGDVVARLERFPDASMLAFVREDSEAEDVERGWLEAVKLQYHLISLTAELQDIEQELAGTPTQENFERLMELKRQMADLQRS